MVENRDKGQFYMVTALAVVVLAISVWAFIQGVRQPGKGGVVQTSLPGKEISQEKKQETKKTLDTTALAQAVLTEVTFETELTQMDASVTESMITTLDENTKIELYMGEGTCSDELLILTAADSKSVDKEVESVQKHLTDMQQSFQDYLPKEAKKIDDAVILQMKNYIVACVSSDKDKAKKVIEEQLNS